MKKAELLFRYFSNNRKYEIDGKLKVNDKNKIFISQKGEMFGDIEWYLNTNKSLFNVVCIEAKGEIAIISRIDIEKYVVPKKEDDLKLIFSLIEGFKMDITQKNEDYSGLAVIILFALFGKAFYDFKSLGVLN